MSLNPPQRRTGIIRGRGQVEMDTLLPLFANLVEKNTPLPVEKFDSVMISGLETLFPEKSEKTLRNYFTEIIGQLYAMYFVEDGIAQLSPLALKLIEDGDQPAFFKVLASRLQFPNPSSKKQTYDQEVSDGLGVRPLVLVLETLRKAHDKKDSVSLLEIAYFILNSEEALKGTHTGASIYADITKARSIKKQIPTLSGSRALQHIKEGMNLLVVANLVRESVSQYQINPWEMETITEICKDGSNGQIFRVRNASESHFDFQQLWKKHLTSLVSVPIDIFNTKVEALAGGIPPKLVSSKIPRQAHEIGRKGELLVIELENLHLSDAYPGEGLQALDYTAKRGIGFDILSIFYNDPVKNRLPHQIEVKTTARVTKPDLSKYTTPDGFTLTRSEKQALDTYGDGFSIYRVFIYVGGSIVQILRDPSKLAQRGKFTLTPETWSAQFTPSEHLGAKNIIEVDSE